MTMRVISRTALASVLAFTAPSTVNGQGMAPAAAPAPWSIFSVRYDTRTSDFIYAGYGYGRVFGMVAALDNPRSGYTELLGAVGRTFTMGDGLKQSVAIGAARATDSWYAQLYYLPSLRAGPVVVRATSELYIPLNHTGVVQLDLSPLSATVRVSPLVEAGLAMDASAQKGAATGSAIGPEIRFALPSAVLGTDVQEVLNSPRSTRFRIFFTTAF